MPILVIAIIVLLALAAVVILATARRRSTTGRLSRETLARDAGSSASAGTDVATTGDSDPRARADETRDQASGTPAETTAAAVTEFTPIDDEELGITRRQFFNRGILAGIGAGLGTFGVASLAFLWPSSAGGTSGRISVGSVAQAESAWSAREPFYNAAARTYVVQYPTDALGNAEGAYAEQPPVLEGMQEGLVALFQRCPHLGCRVPWCGTSQWFECPCHGSKYNRVGEWRDGPAPRGMDRFGVVVEGDSIMVDTSVEWAGPPKGTNTTGQSPEGSPCV